MMIYPALQKEKHSEIYSWISNKFITELNNSNICIIIGYSFRDRDIRENLTDALRKNPKLWLIIISPSASKNKEDHFSNSDDTIHSRIVVQNKTIEETISDRFLYSFLYNKLIPLINK